MNDGRRSERSPVQERVTLATEVFCRTKEGWVWEEKLYVA